MLPSEGASGDQKPPSAQSWLGDELMAKFSFPGSTQNEQLLQDYGALAPLAFILNVISAGQFLQMNLPEPPFFSSPHHLYQIFYPHMLWPKPGPTGVHINQIVAYWPLW